MNRKIKFKLRSVFLSLFILFSFVGPVKDANISWAMNINEAKYETKVDENTGKTRFTLYFNKTDGNPSYAYILGINNDLEQGHEKYKLEWKEITKGKWGLTGNFDIPAGKHQYKFKLHYVKDDKEWEDWYPSDRDNLKITVPSIPISTDTYKLITSNNNLYKNDSIELLVQKTDKDGNISFEKPNFSLAEEDNHLKIENNKLVSSDITSDKTIKIIAKIDGKNLEKTINLIAKENSNKNIHYYRFNKDYDNWNIWYWHNKEKGKSFGESIDSDFGKVFSFNLPSDSHIIIRKGEWILQEKQVDIGTVNNYYIVENDKVYTDFAEAMKAISPKIKVALMDDSKQIKSYLSEEAKANTKFSLYKNNKLVDIDSFKVDGHNLTLKMKDDFSFNANDLLEIRANNQYKSNIVTMRNVLDNYSYDGDDLGIKYKDKSISVKLWAPTAQKVSLLTYKNGDDPVENSIDNIEMNYDAKNGLWSANIDKSKAEKSPFYLFKLDFYKDSDYEKTSYGVDPYAVSLGINGDKAAFVDLDSPETKPDNWENDTKPKLVNSVDSIIYETHVRDFTIDSSSGVDKDLRGKYLGFVQEGTKIPDTDITTGIDHLKELGITHVHLLPTYDYASVDEKIKDDPSNRNWGYDPKNYNAPEGSYSTDPTDPIKRVKEYRQMVQGLHKNGIRLVLDVVYNHMYSTDYMDAIVPGYFFRSDELGNYTNGSGTGNEVATERKMVSKFIVDSTKHWVKDYKADGLRFDLMALIDIDTMKKVTNEIKKIDETNIVYGEPWKAADTPLDFNKQTTHGKQKNNRFAIFNDSFRDSVRGNNDPSGGYVNGDFNNEATNKVINGLKGSIDLNTADPSEAINYVEVHDNYNLFDQISTINQADVKNGKFVDYLRTPGTDYMNEHIIKRIHLAQSLVYTAQGIPLTQAGTEFLRTKYGDHNSYKSDDSINKIDWTNKKFFKSAYEYQKGLIELRKTHPAFRMTNAQSIRDNLDIIRANGNQNVIISHLKNNANGDDWENILVIYNPTKYGYNFNNDGTNLPTPNSSDNKWTLVANSKKVDINSTTKVDARPNVEANSVTILYDRQKTKKTLSLDYLFSDRSIDYLEPMEPEANQAVKVRFRAKAGEVEEAILHYYDKDNENLGDQTIKMEKITDDSFYNSKGLDKNKVEFFQAELSGGVKEKYYNFEVKNSDQSAWISGSYQKGKSTNNGVSKEKPKFGNGIDYGFSLYYGYKSNDKIKESVLYQIIVDRFRNGDTANDRSDLDPAVGKDPLTLKSPSEIFDFKDEVVSGDETDKIWNNEFYNGDLTGVEEALPYLKDQLGVDAIYLSPIFESNSYHKYDTVDYDHVDKNFGGNKVFSELTADVHKKGMSVMIDGVFNHTSSHHQWFKDFYKDKDNNDRYFKYNNEDGYFSWHYGSLPKLNYGQDSLKNEIFEGEDSIVKRYLKAPYNIDGWRMDAAEDLSSTPSLYKEGKQDQKDSNLALWRQISGSIKNTKPDAFILGEYWGSDNQWLDGKAWDGLMNYNAFYNPLVDNNSKNYYQKDLTLSLDNKNGLSIADLGKQTRMNGAKNPHQAILNSTNSISTHDKPRFLDKEFVSSNPDSFMELAQTLQLTYRGIPMIYYGDEIGMKSKAGTSGKDPYNRAPFNWDSSTWNKTIFSNYQKLIASRKKNLDAIVYGAFEEIKSNNDQKYIAFARYGKQDKVLVVLNNNPNNDTQIIELENLDKFGLKDGDELVDVLRNKSYRVKNEKISIDSKNMQALVLVSKDKLGEVADINSPSLIDLNDSREKLDSIKNASYIEKDNEIVFTWDKIPEKDLSKSKNILIRLYDEKKNVLKEIVLDKDVDKYVIDDKEDIRLFKSSKIRNIKILADRSTDNYMDSPFTEIKKKSDKEELVKKIEEAKSLETKGKTEKSIEDLKSAISSAEEINKKSDASEKEIKAAIENLEKAIKGLESIDKKELVSKIEEAKKTETSGKTEKSIEALKSAIKEAEKVNKKSDASEKEIEEAIEKLDSAINGLEDENSGVEEADKKELTENLEKANEIDTRGKTEASKQALKDAIEAAQKIKKDKSASQEEVELAIVKLDEAIKGLKDVDKTELIQKLEEIKNIETDSKSDKTKEKLSKAIDSAENIIEDNSSSESDVKNAIIQLVETIKSAKKEEIEQKLEEANKIDLSGKSEEDIKAFEESMDFARFVISNQDASEEEVKAALAQLEKSIKAIEEDKPNTEEVDKAALEEKIKEAEEFETLGKTEASIKALKNAIEEAEKIKEDKLSSKEEIEIAIVKLDEAIKGLRDVDKTELIQKLEETENIETDGKIDKTKEKLSEAIDSAKKVIKDNSSSESDVENAITQLVETIKSAKKEEITQKLEEAEGLETTGKTEKSKQALSEAIKEAKRVNAKDDASEEEVKVALAQLEKAIKVLKEDKTKENKDDNNTTGTYIPYLPSYPEKDKAAKEAQIIAKAKELRRKVDALIFIKENLKETYRRNSKIIDLAIRKAETSLKVVEDIYGDIIFESDIPPLPKKEESSIYKEIREKYIILRRKVDTLIFIKENLKQTYKANENIIDQAIKKAESALKAAKEIL